MYEHKITLSRQCQGVAIRKRFLIIINLWASIGWPDLSDADYIKPQMRFIPIRIFNN